MTAPTFNKLAKRLADDDPPEWLVQGLGWFGRLIGRPKSDGELETIDKRLFASAKYLEDWLQMYMAYAWPSQKYLQKYFYI